MSSSSHTNQQQQKTKLCFAHYPATPEHPDIILPTPTTDTSPSPIHSFKRNCNLYHNEQLFTLSRHENHFHRVRYGRFVACFNLYPSSNRDIEINNLLWNVAKVGEYNPSVGNKLLENNVLALSFPVQLYSFLKSISKFHLDVCVLEVLTRVIEGEDVEGISLMKQELESSIWNDLVYYILNDQMRQEYKTKSETEIERGNLNKCDSDDDGEVNASVSNDLFDLTGCNDMSDEEIASIIILLIEKRKNVQVNRQLNDDVEMLLRFCSLSPWKIEVYANFITPRDMALILSDLTPHPSPSTSTSIHSQNSLFCDNNRITSTKDLKPSSSVGESNFNNNNNHNNNNVSTTSSSSSSPSPSTAARSLSLSLSLSLSPQQQPLIPCITDAIDRPLVRSSARRPVWASRHRFRQASASPTTTPSSPPSPPSPSSFSNDHSSSSNNNVSTTNSSSISSNSNSNSLLQSSSPETRRHHQSQKKMLFWEQFSTWRMYRKALVHHFHPSLISSAALSAVQTSNGVQIAVNRAETVMACACTNDGNLFSLLPKEVVFRYIAPYVLMTV